MESTIYRFIFRYSRGEQILLLLLTLAAFPFLYMSLDLPKIIINEAIGGLDFPKVFGGYELDQIPYLLVLCAIFLILVLVNGAFKYYINVYRGAVGERMLRRLRYLLFHRVLRFPLPQFRKTSQGELVSMLTAETEPLGGFIGDSIALPAFQGGTLITILVFMFVQDWVLGLAAVVLYPVQALLIPKLQRRVNQLKKERVVKIRKLSERIGEVVSGIRELHTHDTAQFELADFSERGGEIYAIRFNIYKQKFLIKFINNFLAQVTPFFFYSIGGYLVITGELSFGALVAVLAAYKDLSDPWKELLNFYQTKEDARIKYELLVETFEPPGLLRAGIIDDDPQGSVSLLGDLVASNLDLTDEGEGETTFASKLSFRTRLPASIAVLGDAGSGRERFAALVAGLMKPRSGSLNANGVDLLNAPRSITGRRIAYVGPDVHLRAGSVRDNLYHGLKHRPSSTTSPSGGGDSAARALRLREAQRSGNSVLDIHSDWIDYEAVGVSGPDALTERALAVLSIVGLDTDIYQLGLHGTVDPQLQPAFAARVLEARRELGERLREPEFAPLVETFDRAAYNANLSVAENLLFGTPIDPSLHVERLPEDPHVLQVLKDTGLTADFLTIGHKIAALMVDLFADVSPDSELFERYSFIDAEDLPEFKSLLSRVSTNELERAPEQDRRRLLSLPFKLTVARHRLGLIDEKLRIRLLAARQRLAQELPPGSVEFFDREYFNPAVSIQDNILFGRLAYGKARSAAQIGELIGEVVKKLDLRRAVIELGLEQPVGIAAARLSLAQRQKLGLARAVLKRPELMILDQATAALDQASQRHVLRGLMQEFRGRGLIWLIHHASLGQEFDRLLILDSGGVAEQGSYAELDRPGTVLSELAVSAA